MNSPGKRKPQTTFGWKPAYCIGDDTIDDQHRYLFSVANDLVASPNKADLTANVMKLYRYVREHFAYEEALMRKIDYPAYREHVARHDQLMARLTEISGSIGENRWNADEVKEFMNEWLLGHVLEMDTKLGEFIRNA